MSNTKQQSPYIVHDFYKVYNQKTKLLNHLNTTVTDPKYLQLLQSSANQSKCRRYLEHKQKLLPKIDADQLLVIFRQNLSICERILRRDQQNFKATIEHLYGRSYHLKQIFRLALKADRVQEKYSVQLQNLLNLRHSFTSKNIHTFLKQQYVNMLEELPSSASVASSSHKSEESVTAMSISADIIDLRMQQKIEQAQQVITEVSSAQIRDLEEKMFTSNDSLKTRKALGQQKLEAKKQSIRSHMHSIAELESNIADMQLEMNIITVAVTQARGMLDKRMQSMDMSVEELVRLQHMLKSIHGDIAERVHGFADKLSEFDVDGQGASSKQIKDLRKAHLSALDLLETASLVGSIANNLDILEQSKIGKSPSQVKLIDAQIRQNILDGLAEQERSKIGKSPSEIKLIDEQIRTMNLMLAKNDPESGGLIAKELENLEQSKFGKSPSEVRIIDDKIQRMLNMLKTSNTASKGPIAEELDILEQSKIGKSPSQVKLIEGKIEMLEQMMASNNAKSGKSIEQQLDNLERSKNGKSPSEMRLIDAQIRQNLLDELAKQERLKLGKSPSEVKLINKQIRMIKIMLANSDGASGDDIFSRDVLRSSCSEMTLSSTTSCAEAALGKITSALDEFAKSMSSSVTTLDDTPAFDQKGLYFECIVENDFLFIHCYQQLQPHARTLSTSNLTCPNICAVLWPPLLCTNRSIRLIS